MWAAGVKHVQPHGAGATAPLKVLDVFAALLLSGDVVSVACRGRIESRAHDLVVDQHQLVHLSSGHPLTQQLDRCVARALGSHLKVVEVLWFSWRVRRARASVVCRAACGPAQRVLSELGKACAQLLDFGEESPKAWPAVPLGGASTGLNALKRGVRGVVETDQLFGVQPLASRLHAVVLLRPASPSVDLLHTELDRCELLGKVAGAHL